MRASATGVAGKRTRSGAPQIQHALQRASYRSSPRGLSPRAHFRCDALIDMHLTALQRFASA